jgi:hypothetical protein
MKKLFIPALSALGLLAGCNSFLDRQPLGTIAPGNFFTSAGDAEASLTSCYDALQGGGAYGQDLIAMGEMPSDNCTSTNGDVNALEKIIWSSSTGQIYNVYRQAYAGVNRANVVLKYVPTVSMDTARRRQILGEARFIRALNYFNLVRAYGGVPLRLQPSESGASADINLARASADDVYNQVVADLQSAAVQMPVASQNRNRASKNSAYALLARVQLTRRNWAAAQAAAQAVAGASLATSFKSLYPAENQAQNTESLFEVQFNGTTEGNNIIPDLVLPSPPASYSFPKFNIPTAELISYADTVNDRRWAYIGRTNAGRDHGSYVDAGRGSGNDKGPFVYKWTSNPNFFNSPDNTYVLRYAEVLLTQAEAINEQTGPSATALAPLNLVRQRAGLATLTTASAQAATKQALRNEIDRQRRLELAFEGERWWDLLRYARHTQAEPSATHPVTALTVIQAITGAANANYLLFPIPQGEINTNPLVTQNPGY